MQNNAMTNAIKTVHNSFNKHTRSLCSLLFYSQPKDTLKFMESFISTGTSATVVSNRASWLVGEDKLISILQSKIESGTRIEIVTPNEVPEALREKLKGVSFIVTKENVSP